MSATGQRDQRYLLMDAVRNFAERARTAGQQRTMDSEEWHFYAGVQRAAQDVLHAELQAVRDGETEWLRSEAPTFREGYLKASILLATAMASDSPPPRVLLPDMD